MRDTENVKLALFDVDHTLVHGSTGFWFTYYMIKRGLLGASSLFFAVWYTLGHRFGFIKVERLMNRVAGIFTNKPVSYVEEVTKASFDLYVKQHIYPEALKIISVYHEQSVPVVLLSGTSIYILRHLAAEVGAAHFIGNRLVFDGDTATGKMAKPYCYGKGKVELLDKYIAQKGIALSECAAYADSRSDLPLLEAVGRPFAVNPDRKLKKIARQKGWPILKFAAKKGKR
jgi:HAD superfamily hydrolase (TIGR01490 family)